jgi:hypothetical protein
MNVYKSWSNATYYDDDGLKYLLERAVSAIKGLDVPATTKPVPISLHTFDSVRIRYRNLGEEDEKGREKELVLVRDSVKMGQTKNEHVRVLTISIVRRNDLFGSELETMANLGGQSQAKLPPAVLGALATQLVHCLARNSHELGNSIRHAFPQSQDAGPAYGWPYRAAADFVRDQILPSSEVLILDRAKKGAGFDAKLVAARDAIQRTTRRAEEFRMHRLYAQKQLEEALMAEAKAEVAFTHAHNKLRLLEAQAQAKEEE